MFLLIILGYLLRWKNILNAEVARGINELVYSLFLPTLLFYNICEMKRQEAFDMKLAFFAISSIIVIGISLTLIVPRFLHDRKQCGAMVHGCCRSNFIIFGLTVTVPLFGQSSAGPMSLLVAMIVPVYSVISVLVLEYFRKEKVEPVKLIRDIFKNPLIIAAIAGMPILLSGTRLALPVSDFLSSISSMATPMAFILLGADIRFHALKNHGKLLFWAVSGKLVIIPLIFISAGIGFGFRGTELGALMILFAAPSAVATYAMARKMDSDAILAGEIVVFTSLFSVLSIFLWVIALKAAAVI